MHNVLCLCVPGSATVIAQQIWVISCIDHTFMIQWTFVRSFDLIRRQFNTQTCNLHHITAIASCCIVYYYYSVLCFVSFYLSVRWCLRFTCVSVCRCENPYQISQFRFDGGRRVRNRASNTLPIALYYYACGRRQSNWVHEKNTVCYSVVLV